VAERASDSRLVHALTFDALAALVTLEAQPESDEGANARVLSGSENLGRKKVYSRTRVKRNIHDLQPSRGATVLLTVFDARGDTKIRTKGGLPHR